MRRSAEPSNPSGGVGPRRGPTPPALPDNLMERVLDRANLQRAWQPVHANRGAPGIDGMTVDEFPACARAPGATIRHALFDGVYPPAPVRRGFSPKLGGRGQRPLGIPIVRDRLIRHTMQQVRTPSFDPHCSESSCGVRPRRAAPGALRQVTRFLREGRRRAGDRDLAQWFDQVSHDVLRARLSRRVSDRRRRAGVLAGAVLQALALGTPQGSPLSPWLGTSRLDDLDKALERRRLRCARYAAERLIVVNSVRAGRRGKASLTRYLPRRVQRVVKDAKRRVGPIHECPFLGCTVRGSTLRWSDEAVADFQYRGRQLTGRSGGGSRSSRLRRLAQYLSGWRTYVGSSE